MKGFKNNIFVWLLVIFAINFAANKFIGEQKQAGDEIIFSDFITKIENKEIESIDIKNGNKIVGVLNDGSKFYTNGIVYEKLLEDLKNSDVKIFEPKLEEITYKRKKLVII